MSLTPEWSARISRWRQELSRQLTTPLQTLSVEAFFTKDHLTLDQARKGPFKPIAPGTSWGKKWEYGWFRTTATIPPAAKGKRVVVVFDTGAEALLFVNGQAAGAFSWGQRCTTLSQCAAGGEQFEIIAEAYAGHGPLNCGEGPVAIGRDSMPEPSEPIATVKEIALEIFEEEAYQLRIDVETLWELRENIDKNSLRVAKIDEGLRDFTCIADLELPHDEKIASFRKARERLKPLLACTNGSTAPVMYAFGHAHLDVAWLWPLAESERKAARTLSTQLSLAKEYPDYKFLHSQCHLFRFVKDLYPELYQRVKQAVKAGSVIAEGGMWVEADTNITGGESLIRQFIHGKRFFKEEFGVDSELMWLPDVFGYSANLPQIMKGCGIKYFSTQKIFWNYNGGETFPHNTFWWEGIDGSRTVVHLHNDYNSQLSPHHVIQRWNERVQKDGISTRLLPFGWGDGGGGPTRDHLEFANRQKNLEGVPQVRLASPLEYFVDLEGGALPEIVYVGELYFQAHRGTYTSQAKTKRGNRRAEFALREAEMWGVAAQSLKGFAFTSQDLDATWKTVLLCQFHDILPGSSIHRVYEEAEAMHAQAIAQAQDVTGKAVRALAKKSATSVVAFNSLSWPRTTLVELPKEFEGVRTSQDGAVPVQKIGDRTLAQVMIPSCGWITLEKTSPTAVPNELAVTARSLENSLVKVIFDDRGEVVSLFDKETGRELAAGPCNSFRMWKDVPANFDAWDLDSHYVLNPVDLPEPAVMTVVAQGPLVATLRISRKLHQSVMTQEVSLARGSRRIDFKTTIDWKERHKVLKVCFPVDIHSEDAVHEIQMGHVKRPTHKSRQYDADRFEVCNHKWTALCEAQRGCAVLNDCKYGVNVDRNSINLTLLRASIAPDMTADLGKQEFTYSFYSWNTSFDKSNVIAESYDLNAPATVVPGDAGTMSLFEVDATNVVVETVKPAEDGSRDIVVRLYESMRTATRCVLSTSLPVAGGEETDMLERPGNRLSLPDGKLNLEFKPFEIKTVRLRMK